MPDSTTPDAAASVLGVSSPKEEDFLIEILKQEKDNIRNSCNVVLAWFALSVGANGTALAELKGPDRPNYMIPLVMLLIATNFTGAYFSWRVGINVDKAIAKIRKITASLFRGSKEREHLAEPSVLYSLWSRALRGFTLAQVAIGIAWCAAVVVAIYSEKFNTYIFLFTNVNNSATAILLKTFKNNFTRAQMMQYFHVSYIVKSYFQDGD